MEAAKRLDAKAVRLAVVAHIRHEETDYGLLLASGHEGWDERNEVEGEVERILSEREAKV